MNFFRKLASVLFMFFFSFSIFSAGASDLIDVEKRQQESDIKTIYDEVKTPYNYEVVFKPTGKDGDFDSKLVDTPTIFQYKNMWYMSYQGHDGTGYRTGLAKSNDLVNWERVGMILDTSGKDAPEDSFDKYNAGGFIAVENVWGKPPVPLKHNGKYVMTYVASSQPGYEKGRIVCGLAFADKIEGPWVKFEKPILVPGEFKYEADKIWRTNIVKYGDTYYIFYNTGAGPEVAAMATSKDLINWKKYEGNPILQYSNNSYEYGYNFHCDPQVVKILNKWVMFFFTDTLDEGVLDSFAISDDLYNWKDSYTMLTKTDKAWNSKCAHKPTVFKYKDTVYHFYCAVSDDSRAIALATNKENFDKNYKSLGSLGNNYYLIIASCILLMIILVVLILMFLRKKK